MKGLIKISANMPRLSALLSIGIAFSVGTLLGMYLQLPNTASRDAWNVQISVEKRNAEDSPFLSFNVRDRRAIIRKPSAILESSEQAFSGSVDNGAKANSLDKTLEVQPVISKQEVLQMDKSAQEFTGENLARGRNDRSRHRANDRRYYNTIRSKVSPTATPYNITQVSLQNMSDQQSATWNGSNIISNGIYWSGYLEGLLPKGFTSRHVKNWMNFARSSPVVKMQEGCGRMQNRLLTFGNGTLTCCRYRQNMDQLQGEVFSYYLSRILGIFNVPPSVLSLVRNTDWQWYNVSEDIPIAEWKQDKIVILTEWIDHLTPAYIPKQFREENRKMHPTREILDGLEPHLLSELVQWSDLIVFDYLTANFDRVANNMFNRQWNEFIMDSPTHNLEKIKQDGTLVFYDNESGLLHSYRLLEKYAHFHDSLLNSLCVFRTSTAEAITRLHEQQNIGDEVWNMFQREEPLFRELPKLPRGNVETLNKRIGDVYQQIKKCEKLYAR